MFSRFLLLPGFLLNITTATTIPVATLSLLYSSTSHPTRLRLEYPPSRRENQRTQTIVTPPGFHPVSAHMDQLRFDTKTGTVKIEPVSVALPKRRKRDLPWLLILAIIVPPLAVYLDGASVSTYQTLFWVWILGLLFWIPLPFAVGWAIIYLLRTTERRQMARPARHRLWVKNPEGKRPFEEATSPAIPEASTTARPEGIAYRQTPSRSIFSGSGGGAGGAGGAADGGGGCGGDGGGGCATTCYLYQELC